MRRQFTFAHFADNFRECAALNAFHEEIFKLHFLLNQGRSIFFLKETRLQLKMRHCFVSRSVRVTQHAVRPNF